jgi:integral membrane sensor domain MASE1
VISFTLRKVTEMNIRGGITWRQPAVFVVATVVCTFLAIWAVISAPVAPVPGVSGLYIAAAIYVPLALWFGVWGCLAGYFSCVFMGLYLGYSLDFLAVWSLCDFFEGFVPLVIYRSLKIKPTLKLKRPKATYVLVSLLALDVVVSALAYVYSYSEVFVATFALGIVLLVIQAAVDDLKAWLTWLVVGVFVASIVSGIFGVGALALFGEIPLTIFPTVFFGWIFGDIIVLSTIGTVVAIILTSYIVKSRIHVRGYIS